MSDTEKALAAKIHQHYTFECFGPDGRLKWREEVENLVVTEGMNDILTKYYKAGTGVANYVGLKGAGTVVAADVMNSHAGWSEVTAYSESVRQTLTMGTASAGSIDNSASKATFSMNGAYTVAGAFVTSNSAKSGTTGVLVGGGDFAASRSGGSGDSIQVTVTASLT
jgi:hypothetical protein